MHGPVRVPDDADKGVAKVTLSFPRWRQGCVTPVTVEMPF